MLIAAIPQAVSRPYVTDYDVLFVAWAREILGYGHGPDESLLSHRQISRKGKEIAVC